MPDICRKKIKYTMRDIGIYATGYCCKDVHKDGMCLGHYKRHQMKLVNWGDRPNYIEITPEEMKNGKSMKLKASHIHKMYRMIGGIIHMYHARFHNWQPTTIQADNTLFCRKS